MPEPVTHSPKWGAIVATVMVAGVFVYAAKLAGWPREAALMVGIFALAAGLWVTEAVPLFVTSLFVILLELLVLVNPGGWPGLGFESAGNPPASAVLSAAADPVLLLFFGGFLVARALTKEGVDRLMCAMLMKPFGSGPDRVLLGFLGVNAFLSMWMSNTATAAMTMALAAPLVAAIPPGDPLRKAIYLAIPVGANLGGLGTPIASPPNAVAVGFLRSSGVTVAFGEWMLIAVPVVSVLLVASWWILRKLYPSTVATVTLPDVAPQVTRRGRAVLAVFAGAVALWLTDQWHGIPPPVVGLLAAVVLTGTGLINREDLGRVDWSVLILIAGGIALGNGVQLTGLDTLLVDRLPMDGGALALLGVVALTTILVSTFMSNTAAANLLLPVFLAAAPAAGVPALPAALAVAFSAGGGMLLPGSTPPNAIAYGSGEFTSRDLLKVGAIVAAMTAVLVTLAARLLIEVAPVPN